MAEQFYVPGRDRARRVNDLFSLIASRYDLINDLQSAGLHRLWKRRLVDLLAPREGELALDLCCGTGDISSRLAQRQARVVGMDFNAPMLGVAVERQQPAESRNPRYVQGDALGLPSSSAFDAVTVGYGLRNLSALEDGLKEIHRILKPGGRFVALEFGRPNNVLIRSGYFGILKMPGAALRVDFLWRPWGLRLYSGLPPALSRTASGWKVSLHHWV